MDNFTYEFENRCEQLETYEWDNIWLEHANKEGLLRVLYIGDSISCATRRIATSIAGGDLFFDGFGTSKALDNPYFTDSIHLFARQQENRRAVIFNNGLHGWHLDDEIEYKQEYEKMIRFLLQEFADTPLILLLTTHVKNPVRDARVIMRNRVVSNLAEKYNLLTIDAYTLTKEHEEFISADGVHLTNEGYQSLANKMLEKLKEVIN